MASLLVKAEKRAIEQTARGKRASTHEIKALRYRTQSAIP
jgi:hypothetical protein